MNKNDVEITPNARNADGVIERFSISDFENWETGEPCTEEDMDDEMRVMIAAQNEQYTILHDRFGASVADGANYGWGATDEGISSKIYDQDYYCITTTFGNDGSSNSHILKHNEDREEPVTLAAAA